MTTFTKKFEQLQNDIIASLTAITDRPESWLPHTVYVEEEDINGNAYNAYRLVDFNPDGSCTLQDPATGENDTERDLSEINIDWLLVLLNWYEQLKVRERADTPQPESEYSESTPEHDDGTPPLPFAEGDLVCLTEEAVEKVRSAFGDAPADYRKAMLLNVCSTDPDTGTIRVQDIRENDIQEYSAQYLRHLLPKEERHFLTATDATQIGQIPCVYLYPIDHFERNATDEEIIAGWEGDNDYDFPIRLLTPDELAAEHNDDNSGYSGYYIRFINR